MTFLNFKAMAKYLNQPMVQFRPILGIDIGTMKTGLAISNKMRTHSYPLEIIKNNDKCYKKISKILTERDCVAIVAGAAYNLDGSESAAVFRSKVFIKTLFENVKINIPCILWDETGSTQDAIIYMANKGYGKKKQMNKEDAIAASLILQSFLKQLPLPPQYNYL